MRHRSRLRLGILAIVTLYIVAIIVFAVSLAIVRVADHRYGTAAFVALLAGFFSWRVLPTLTRNVRIELAAGGDVVTRTEKREELERARSATGRGYVASAGIFVAALILLTVGHDPIPGLIVLGIDAVMLIALVVARHNFDRMLNELDQH